MDYLNVTIIGNTVRNALVKQNEKGEFAILDIAVKTRSGKTAYFSAFVSGRLMEIVKDIEKGTPVFIDGALEIEEYSPEGKDKRLNLNVSANTLRILSKRTAEPEEEVDVEKAAKEIFDAKEEEIKE